MKKAEKSPGGGTGAQKRATLQRAVSLSILVSAGSELNTREVKHVE